MPAAMPETAAAMRTTQQQQTVEQEDNQQSSQPFIVWVGMAAEAASAFETSSYLPRQGMYHRQSELLAFVCSCAARVR